MGVAGWVQHTSAGISHVGDDADEVEVVHELDGFFTASLQAEGDDTTRTIRQVLLTSFIVFIAWQTAVVHPTHLRVLFQPLCHLLGISTMLTHAEMESFQSEIEKEGVLRSRNGTEVTHELGNELG